MPNSQITITSAKGLEISTNSFQTPDGSFQQATNCVIKTSGVVKKRRGFSLLTQGAQLPVGTTLVPYRGSLLVCYNNGMGVLNTTTGVVSSLTGAVNVSANSKVRHVGAGANLFLATSTGVRKLSSISASVIDAGLPAALDTAATVTTTAGWLGAAQAGYRITFCRTDENNNFIQSAPSDFITVNNPPVDLGPNYSAYSSSGSLLTITTSASHGFTGTIEVTIGAVSVTTGGPTLAEGTYFGTVTSGTTFTLPITSAAGTGTCSVTIKREVTLNFTLPLGLLPTDTVRIYRTAQSAIPTTGSVSADEDTLSLVSEVFVGAGTSQSLTDSVPDDLRGALLYTNPNTGAGILQANYPPPFARDVTVFKDSLFFANTSLDYQMDLDLLTTKSTYLTAGTDALFTIDATNSNAVSAITLVSGSTFDVFFDNTAGLFVTGQFINLASTANATNNGNFAIASTTSTSVRITVPSGVAEAAGLGTVVRQVRGYLAAASENFSQVYGADFALTNATTSVFDPITNTARSLVRAINRDAGGLCYAKYASDPDGSPGQMLLSSRAFGKNFAVNVARSSSSGAFNPAPPVSGIAKAGKNDPFTNRLYFSKTKEFEHVPLTNYLDVGSRSTNILRIVPLRDSLIVVTDAGVYRVTGSSPASFFSYALDLTVVCLAADSVQPLSNLVFMLSNQGVVAVSDSNVQVMSLPIETVLQAAFSKSNLATETDAVAYESERLYLLSTMSPQATSRDTVYCFSTVQNAWTTWDTTIIDGVTNPAEDVLYLLRANGDLEKERKLNNKLDFTGHSYAATLSSVSADGTQATLTVSGSVPVAGDALVVGTIIGRLDSVSGTGPYIVQFASAVPFATGAATLYKAITSTLITNPLTAGDPSRMKQFSEFQVQLRNRSCTRAQVSFLSDNTIETVAVDWKVGGNLEGGFGLQPWGLFPWGNQEGIATVYTTEANQVVRVFVPGDAQRSTYIQSKIIHSQAAEACEIQALATTTRGYSQRVTK